MISQNRQISRYRNLHGWPKEFIDGLQTGMDGSWRVRGANKPTDGDEHHLLGGNLEIPADKRNIKITASAAYRISHRAIHNSCIQCCAHSRRCPSLRMMNSTLIATIDHSPI